MLLLAKDYSLTVSYERLTGDQALQMLFWSLIIWVIEFIFVRVQINTPDAALLWLLPIPNRTYMKGILNRILITFAVAFVSYNIFNYFFSSSEVGFPDNRSQSNQILVTVNYWLFLLLPMLYGFADALKLENVTSRLFTFLNTCILPPKLLFRNRFGGLLCLILFLAYMFHIRPLVSVFDRLFMLIGSFEYFLLTVPFVGAFLSAMFIPAAGFLRSISPASTMSGQLSISIFLVLIEFPAIATIWSFACTDIQQLDCSRYEKWLQYTHDHDNDPGLNSSIQDRLAPIADDYLLVTDEDEDDVETVRAVPEQNYRENAEPEELHLMLLNFDRSEKVIKTAIYMMLLGASQVAWARPFVILGYVIMLALLQADVFRKLGGDGMWLFWPLRRVRLIRSFCFYRPGTRVTLDLLLSASVSMHDPHVVLALIYTFVVIQIARCYIAVAPVVNVGSRTGKITFGVPYVIIAFFSTIVSALGVAAFLAADDVSSKLIYLELLCGFLAYTVFSTVLVLLIQHVRLGCQLIGLYQNSPSQMRRY
jgi:hypothetical protein